MRHKIRWTVEKIEQRIALLETFVYRRHRELPPFRLHLIPDTEDAPPLFLQSIDDNSWPEVEANSYWASWNSNFILRTKFQCDFKADENCSVALWLPLGDSYDFSHPEALIYIDETPLAACDRNHREVLLPEPYCDGKPHLLALEGWTGLGKLPPLPAGSQLLMGNCQIVQVDRKTRDFLAIARVALGVAKETDGDYPAKGHLLNALDEAFKQLDIREPASEEFYTSIPRAHEILQKGIAQAGEALDVTVSASGHAHIDVAWLWTLAQTRKKCGRTFHTVQHLMEQFPDYHFTQSQPQLYDYVRQDYPELFETIKQRVAEGRWEPIGGMWVEADCNLSGAESLARQFLLGRRFFREHFGEGAESPVLWLPDVFGYAWNLPQLIKEAGLEYFFTIKIGWNQYNRLPYDSFWWQGLDGTKVLTHFSCTPDPGGHGISTYNATATPDQNLGTWKQFQQKELSQDLLMAFGYGDGGGGPTREMLENIREMADFPAVPRMVQRPVEEFFRKMEERSGERLPTWNGELYLELHRGTYTTQSRNKRANRKSEFLLHDAEFLASMAHIADTDYQYPAEKLNEAWQLVCLNQFHDIIPGSSIQQVYVDSQQQYAEVRQIGEEIVRNALEVLKQHVKADVLIVNPTSFEQSKPAFLPEELPEQTFLQDAEGKRVATQNIEGGTLIDVEQIPPFSLLALKKQAGQNEKALQTGELAISSAPPILENTFIRLEWSSEGDLIRIFDKANQREVLPQGEIANQFIAFEDRPKSWDAWDIDVFYDDKSWLSEAADSIEIIERGPLRATFEIRRRILKSEYTQRISLRHNSPEIRFDTMIQWNERQILLKTAFPVDVLSPMATYEIQWGNVERPTHQNTSWDWARFETCAQKWVDLSEGDYGVSLLNDCKYGHDIRDNVIRLSLLRGTTAPDPTADLGEHHFSYSLLPHAGRWNENTIAAAYALNDPLIASSITPNPDPQIPSKSLASPKLLISVDRPNIVIETIKWAEDGNGLIVRCYESQRQRGPVTFTTSFPLAAAERTNILEKRQEALSVKEHSVALNIKPYQIVTLRLTSRPS